VHSRSFWRTATRCQWPAPICPGCGTASTGGDCPPATNHSTPSIRLILTKVGPRLRLNTVRHSARSAPGGTAGTNRCLGFSRSPVVLHRSRANNHTPEGFAACAPAHEGLFEEEWHRFIAIHPPTTRSKAPRVPHGETDSQVPGSGRRFLRRYNPSRRQARGTLREALVCHLTQWRRWKK